MQLRADFAMRITLTMHPSRLSLYRSSFVYWLIFTNCLRTAYKSDVFLATEFVDFCATLHGETRLRASPSCSVKMALLSCLKLGRTSANTSTVSFASTWLVHGARCRSFTHGLIFSCRHVGMLSTRCILALSLDPTENPAALLVMLLYIWMFASDCVLGILLSGVLKGRWSRSLASAASWRAGGLSLLSSRHLCPDIYYTSALTGLLCNLLALVSGFYQAFAARGAHVPEICTLSTFQSTAVAPLLEMPLRAVCNSFLQSRCLASCGVHGRSQRFLS